MAGAQHSCRAAAVASATRPRLSSAAAAVARRLFHLGCLTPFACSRVSAPLRADRPRDCSISGSLWNSCHRRAAQSTSRGKAGRWKGPERAWRARQMHAGLGHPGFRRYI